MSNPCTTHPQLMDTSLLVRLFLIVLVGYKCIAPTCLWNDHYFLLANAFFIGSTFSPPIHFVGGAAPLYWSAAQFIGRPTPWTNIRKTNNKYYWSSHPTPVVFNWKQKNVWLFFFFAIFPWNNPTTNFLLVASFSFIPAPSPFNLKRRHDDFHILI